MQARSVTTSDFMWFSRLTIVDGYNISCPRAIQRSGKCPATGVTMIAEAAFDSRSYSAHENRSRVIDGRRRASWL